MSNDPRKPTTTRQPPQRVPDGTYTQVNIMFPSEKMELPSADKFNAFPPEAQKAILAAFEREGVEREGVERHQWLKTQQANDFLLNNQSENHVFVWKMTGTVSALLISMTALIVGAWLVKSGASTIGATSMFFALATLVGTAIYGKATASKTPQNMDGEADENG